MYQHLIDKYNLPIPRYTSYPTVPFWQEDNDQGNWIFQLKKAISSGKAENGISLYLHLPFCESLCTYCGCNKRITTNHGVEQVYLQAILKEWNLYLDVIRTDVSIRELHLGGGTPTFFSPENLDIMMKGIFEKVDKHPDFEGSFEGHPNNTTAQHLEVLYMAGFRRVSFGVQDMDIKVQKAINRIQPLENLVKATETARNIGYTSVNYDLIYGLPFQTDDSIRQTFEAVIQLRPDRIAYYSYAHVPWTSKSQRAYNDSDLPAGKDKMALYQLGKSMLQQAGYADVGMDHFSLPGEALLQALESGTLHRNFMGYTTSATNILIGLGVSAISDAFFAYRQNVKTVEEYYERLKADELPVFRGIDLCDEDILRRKHILEITCRLQTEIPYQDWVLSADFQSYLKQLVEDGLLEKDGNKLKVTSVGRQFIRNIAALFDATVTGVKTQKYQMFSKAV
jgi:oxygen-independent coproporphyrinogen III oxidase